MDDTINGGVMDKVIDPNFLYLKLDRLIGDLVMANDPFERKEIAFKLESAMDDLATLLGLIK